jgi:hypothetical protein
MKSPVFGWGFFVGGRGVFGLCYDLVTFNRILGLKNDRRRIKRVGSEFGCCSKKNG